MHDLRLLRPFIPLALTVTLALAAPAAAQTVDAAPLRPVPAIDLQRYLGTWYELAKLPNWFQRKCAADTRAVYGLRENGTLRVDNACRNAEGGVEQAIGAARVTGPSTLEVRFAPDWLAFLPFVWANYWIVDLDADYTLAAVSEPGRRYLWILSRTPSIPPDRWEALMGRLRAIGLDTAALERTPQSDRPLR